MRKVSMFFYDYPPNRFILRQSPFQSGIWGNYQFEQKDIVNMEDDNNKIVIVLQPYLHDYIDKAKDLEHKLKILILTEPEHITSKIIDEKFIKYDFVITPYRSDLSYFKNKVFSFVPLPWTIGTINKQYPPRFNDTDYSKTYDELKKIKFNKEKNLSLISSNLKHSDFHFKRIEFVQELKEHFKNDLDLYGFEIKHVNDKWDALSPYKYTIVIENGSIDYWWAEKVSDAILSGCFMFYWGCPNMDRWFDPETFAYIDLFDKNKTISIINTVIKNNIYEKVKDKIEANRQLILNKYQFFPYMANFLDGVLR